jgi:NADPH:quinone reductase-like Zn-dependent oxidoreductase
MKAAVWHGKRDVRVDTVPDPTIQQPTDAIVRITTTGLCGSDLHLDEVLGPFMAEGDVLGHEPMGVVEAVGSAVTDVAVGDRVVMPFQISCRHCFILSGKCGLAQVTSFDLVLLLITSQAVGQALLGSDPSVTTALIIALTLPAVNRASDVASDRPLVHPSTAVPRASA